MTLNTIFCLCEPAAEVRKHNQARNKMREKVKVILVELQNLNKRREIPALIKHSLMKEAI